MGQAIQRIADDIAAHKAVLDGIENGDWPDPEPLFADEGEPTDFPVDALGDLKEVVEDIAKATKAPIAIVATSVISVANFAVQNRHDVEFHGGARRPLSLFFATIGVSGERKSTADRLAQLGFVKFDRNFANPPITCDGEPLFDDTRPGLKVASATAEGLRSGFMDGPPSQYLSTDEGGQVFGGYSLGRKQNKLAALAILSKFWDGDDITHKVKGEGQLGADTINLRGRRLSLHILAQPEAIAAFINDPMSSGQGILARMLVHKPKSTIGTRFTTTEEWKQSSISPAVSQFADAIYDHLERSDLESGTALVERPVLCLDDNATDALVSFYNELEKSQSKSGEFYQQSDYLNKAHENAARLAGTLAAFRNATSVSLDDMQRAIAIMWYFVAEIVRLTGHAEDDATAKSAEKLAQWLSQRGDETVSLKQISKNGPKQTRKKDKRDEAIDLLESGYWVTRTSDRKGVILNPKLASRTS